MGSMPCLHPRASSARPEPPAAAPAERGPGLERLPPGPPVRLLFSAPESSWRSPILEAPSLVLARDRGVAAEARAAELANTRLLTPPS
ncbi:hypothetical protein NDU88_005098 [Pleurodeles waltl]|uniref:Uncharacterized protein n=1 Tax=Pleurodeles waltl TaxID=8319 RepID=A0AAV7LNL1_PLEWA|nr:hypothetical protein NDU88_005098 [Pleurodeles waltl]